MYPHLGEGCDKGCLPVHQNYSGWSLPIHSLGLIRLVGINLTSTRMRLTDIWADCGTSYEVPLRYWYCWTPMSPSQATSWKGSIVCLACKAHPLVLRRGNNEAGAVLRSILWMNSTSYRSAMGVSAQDSKHPSAGDVKRYSCP